MAEEYPSDFTVRGSILLGDELVSAAVSIRNGRISEVHRGATPEGLPEPVIDAAIVSPGLVDLQVNGGYGHDVGEEPDAIRLLAERLPETGVTAFLPTVISSPEAQYERLFTAFAALGELSGARPLGLHLEGPLLSPQRPGAHDPDVIRRANPALLNQFAATPYVRVVTLAPERMGATECIPHLVREGVTVSLGHTNATAAELQRGIDAGASMITHLYNAMSPFEHRNPNTVGVALTDSRAIVGVIADGIHVHPIGLTLAVRAKGADRIALVTDMMAATGMPPGEYPLGGRRVLVDETSARLADGTLAGSTITLDACLRNMVRWTGVTPAQALKMASEIPSRLLRTQSVGRIEVGLDADLVFWDADLTVRATFVQGTCVYQRPG